MARFTVYAAQEGRHSSHVIEGDTFEDAALAFTQMYRPHAEEDAAGVRLRVVERDSGEQQCFVVDLCDPNQVSCG